MRRYDLNEQGVLVRWLRSRYEGNSIHAITKSIAAELLVYTNQSHPPIDLFIISKARRIRHRTVPQLATDGRLSVNKEGFILEVKEGYQTRKRFTMAHEIAHTIFYDLSASPPQRLLHGARTKEEESFCSILASELLMPSEFVKVELIKLNTSDDNISPITLLRRLASIFRVSLEAMTRRVIEDIQLLNGVVLGLRWLPGVLKSASIEPTGPAWRLRWWAASPTIIEPLYLPAVSRRPKLVLDVIEDTFSASKHQKVRLEINTIKLGNLKKILNQALYGLTTVDVWAQSIQSKGLQFDASADSNASPSDYDNFTLTPPREVDDINKQAREQSEMVILFSLERNIELPFVQYLLPLTEI